jgi:hypothetical protein
MITPEPRAIIAGTRAWVRKIGARMLIAMTASNVASSSVAVELEGKMPASLTRMSTRPPRISVASLASCRTSPVEAAMSARTKSARPPESWISATVAWPRSASRPVIATCAPSAASAGRADRVGLS